MKFYEITYIIEDEQQERLSALAERYIVGTYGWKLLGIVSPIILLHSYGRRNRTNNKRNHRKLQKNA